MSNKFIVFLLAVLLLVSCGRETDQNISRKEVTGSFEERDLEKLSDPSLKLARELTLHAEPNDDGNVFVSPVSLFMAVSMLQNGAEGETRAGIIQAIQANEMSPDELNRANASLLDRIQYLDEDTTVHIANSLWINDNYTLQDDFKSLIHDYYLGSAEEIDVSKRKSAERINQWASDSTNGKIEEIVEPQLPGNLVMYLMNAVYFKADWTYPFSAGATADGNFHLEDGSEATVPFMSLQKTVPYMENDEFQAVSLPYGKGEMTMDIYVPKENSNIDVFLNSWTSEKHRMWMETFEEQTGTVQLPRFELEYEAVLNSLLSELGMERAFSDQAELGKLTVENKSLFVSEVKQKTFLSVDEDGTEAAAVTSVGVSEASAPAETFKLRADRPFFLTIREQEADIILFAGKIMYPDQ
ncbi:MULTISPECIES: serpin family protein [unclassified Sporosarcina]|uniref:serpin family protein n=1 Tax=unclassified Sporosarcina TaxID=2647733 RepID=UPI00203C2864|nr:MULTISPECIES: serpin family protein [unclassified Sporosarcina]GKV66459.1 serine protease inhibitor [Sporosarcina sp. NCCP-2331]GLB56677.1 serine protease inhibitor [Sporosarcina sp. NCCP-2378]